MATEGLRSAGGAIKALVDHAAEALAVDFSSSAEEGGGRSPYNPPNILPRGSSSFFFFFFCH
uniref:Uncharacterized protein n=1 Tax=Rhizophora mucronata TaxID=61149 RepID=A0A2P2MZZ0_RHIMU